MVAVSPSPPPAPRDVKFLCVSPPWWTVARDYPPRVLRPAYLLFIPFPLSLRSVRPSLPTAGEARRPKSLEQASHAAEVWHVDIIASPTSPRPLPPSPRQTENVGSCTTSLRSAPPSAPKVITIISIRPPTQRIHTARCGGSSQTIPAAGSCGPQHRAEVVGDAAVCVHPWSRRVRWTSRPGNRRSAAEGTPTDLPSERPAGTCLLCTPSTDRCLEQPSEIEIRTPVLLRCYGRCPAPLYQTDSCDSLP